VSGRAEVQLAAAEVGSAAVHAVPLRLRNEVIGALNFFDMISGLLDAGKLCIGQALADVATIELPQQRTIHRGDVLTEQLHIALNGRVLIEGLLAERLHVDVADAFSLLRNGARSQNRRLSELARARDVRDGGDGRRVLGWTDPPCRNSTLDPGLEGGGVRVAVGRDPGTDHLPEVHHEGECLRVTVRRNA
jgi:hypothetical protein